MARSWRYSSIDNGTTFVHDAEYVLVWKSLSVDNTSFVLWVANASSKYSSSSDSVSTGGAVAESGFTAGGIDGVEVALRFKWENERDNKGLEKRSDG